MQGSPVARRWRTSADSAARSASEETIRYSSGEWIAPPRTPIVSTTGTPQAAMLLPSQTPPLGCQPMRLAEVGAAVADQVEQPLRRARRPAWAGA